MYSIIRMSHRCMAWLVMCSLLMSSGISDSVVKWRCDNELLANTTTRLPEASMARRVTRPSSIIISCITSTE